VAVAPVRQSVKEDIVAAILLCLSLALLLPLGAMLYLDVLQTNQEVKQELIKLQKLRRQIEQKEKDK
jgi:cell division protein FtsB